VAFDVGGRVGLVKEGRHADLLRSFQTTDGSIYENIVYLLSK